MMTVIPSHEMQGYILTAQRQEQRRQEQLEHRRQKGLAGAATATARIKNSAASRRSMKQPFFIRYLRPKGRGIYPL